MELRTEKTRSPLPTTGQIVSYDTGDDGEYQAGARGTRWIDNGDGTVSDLLDGLMWLEVPATQLPGTYNWAAALAAAEALDFAGFDDWRLPNRNELAGLLDANAAAAPLVDPVFTMANTTYWTSTTPRSDTAGAWFILFSGTMVISTKAAPLSITACRGGVLSG